MSIQEKTVNNALVLYDDRAPQRWIDAFGPDVVKYLGELNHGMDDQTGDPDAFTTTDTSDGAGTSTLAKALTAGQLFKITCAAFDYDGINATLKGEAFLFTPGKPIYFGIKFQSNDVTASDFVFGLVETDTTLLAADTGHAIAITGDGAFFSSLDTSTVVAFKTYVAGAETNTANADTALVDDTNMVLEFFYDGVTLSGYQNGELVGTFTANLPASDQTLTPSLAFLTGENVANTANIAWLRAMQAR